MVKHLPARILRDVREGRTIPQTSESATPPPGGPVDYYQATAAFQVRLIREALAAAPSTAYRHPREPQLPMPEAVSDFAALSDTQHGKL